MGSVKKMLFTTKLPNRERHHSRLFIDLAENIHIHHREFRTVFSLDEYFEYADIVNKSTKDVRNFLAQNPDYKEGVYPTTIMIAGGKERQLKFLKNSPKPNETEYFSNDFAIELQDEFVTDEIHIHYRDFRIALNREHFKTIAKGFADSLNELEDFEKNNVYEREVHNDRIIADFNNSTDKDTDTKIMGVKKVELVEIKSEWYKNIFEEWNPDKQAIQILQDEYKSNCTFFPIVLSTEKDGTHKIIDGHHRVYAAFSLNLAEIDAVITNLTFEETEKIRKAESLLKEFDNETNYNYSISSFMKEYWANKLNRYYVNSFIGLMRHQKLHYRILRKIKRLIFGKRNIFKTFNEPHNN